MAAKADLSFTINPFATSAKTLYIQPILFRRGHKMVFHDINDFSTNH